MKKILIKRVFHREKWRYAMVFEYDPVLQSIAKSVKGAAYSGTLKFWYVDESESGLREIITSFRNKADIDISEIASPSARMKNHDGLVQTTAKSQPENTENEPFPGIETELPRTETVVDEDYFEEESPKKKGKYGPVEFRIDNGDGRLSIKFTGYYDKSWIDEIKSYGKVYYDRQHREFLLRWSKITTDSLSDYFASKNVEVRIIRQQPTEVIRSERRNSGDEIRSRELKPAALNGIEELRKYLEENRYSYRTIETYLALLELFFKYYNGKDPAGIRQNEVSEFMNEFVIKKGFSGSYQNQMISAIKMFYEITGKGRIAPDTLERPRRGKSLPKVFSKEEIVKILNAGRNQKHKLLLWMIYSCGLRRSEVTNIKLTDLDRNRSLLHIREGKGNVDRIVPVSDKVWQKIDEYLEAFSPNVYLFEGQNGGRYSSESVYGVFKHALERAGIKKDVGVHCLRHSYATHLHESGLDIRYIQELLGHKSTKTTEIYTHVSRRNLVAVKSPIDDIDVK